MNNTAKNIVCSSLFLYSSVVCADTYLCIAEAAAGVSHGGPSGIQASTYDASEKKFILTNESGKWLVKELGNDYALFDNCVSKYHCERKDGYAGAFLRGNDGYFSVTWFTGNETEQYVMVAKGRCSKV